MAPQRDANETNVLLSEVTDMRNGSVCIAGWSNDTGAMVRPLRGFDARHWPKSFAEVGILAVGNELRLKGLGTEGRRGFPHANEDIPVEERVEVVASFKGSELTKRLHDSLSQSVEEIFGDCLIDKKYVHEGSRCPSLGVVEIDSRRMGFKFQRGKLRCWFYDATNTPYDFCVADYELQALSIAEGLEPIQSRQRGCRRAHVRLGLAHGWTGPEGDYSPRRCYVQINGIIFE